ncbi:hypothetical protein FB009_11797 [Sinorhizobium medicae]|uniref:SU10 major capsid protein n=1 Tax=Sinorhizobium medicae TaxID=110321 RepID=UPI0011992B52|nr:DUF5309 family protein [Sinorhizobium medicae]MQU78040.1 phage head protein [Sinorhizobium medicae]TWA34088.1 hypothetical protein FB009_11797 [Sinorhizobium medicae]
MATLKTTDVSHVREDLEDIISNISPEDTPFLTSIAKVSASQKTHEWTQDKLRARNKNNAAIEGAEAAAASNSAPVRLRNHAQIFTETVQVSGSLIASDTVGSKNELAYQLAKSIKQVKGDIEATAVSEKASSLGEPREMGGMEAWVKTNALHGTGGVTAGYNSGTGLVGAVTDGTARALSHALIVEMAEGIHSEGGVPKILLVPPAQKKNIVALSNGTTKFQDASKKTVFGDVTMYETPFGRFDIVTSRDVRSSTVIGYDPELWAQAVFRGLTKKKLPEGGDYEGYQVITEVTLVCRNEAGNGKVADLS